MIAHLRSVLSLALAGALLASPAAAQLSAAEKAAIQLAEPPPREAQPDIVVTGRAPPKVEEVTRQARAITRSDDVFREPMARYQDGVCPGIVGLPVEAAELIVDRIRYDAEQAGVPLARANKCTPNLMVVVTRNGQADVQALVRSRGYLFKDMTPSAIAALTQDAGPIHAWSTIARRGRHGEAFTGEMDLNGKRVPMLQEPMAHSKIYLTTRLEILSSVVLIDVKAILGLSIDQIADYAAMRAFADTRPPEGATASSTILTLFNPDGPVADGLTEFDRAYLKSAYGSEANMPVYGKLVSAAKQVHADAKAR